MRKPRKQFAYRIIGGCAVAAALIIGEATAVGGTSGARSPDALPTEAPPAVIHAVPGTGLHRLVLSAHAVSRLGIQTEPIRKGLIPVTAVVYDDNGQTWTYTSPAPLTYVRAAVSIGAVRGDWAVLLSGPPPGTAVVTVGSAELLGTEYGVGGER
jgi:hypothetical protein